MNYNEWREKYSPHGMYNEAMARAAWNAAIEAAAVLMEEQDTQAPKYNAKAIRALKEV